MLLSTKKRNIKFNFEKDRLVLLNMKRKINKRGKDKIILFNGYTFQFLMVFRWPTIYSNFQLLYFDLLTRPKKPFKVMHRKEVTHSNGSYVRKSRGRKLADEIGRAKKNSHGTLIDWYTGREWPLNCMTVISAWWRLNIRFQRSSGCQTII